MYFDHNHSLNSSHIHPFIPSNFVSSFFFFLDLVLLIFGCGAIHWRMVALPGPHSWRPHSPMLSVATVSQPGVGLWPPAPSILDFVWLQFVQVCHHCCECICAVSLMCLEDSFVVITSTSDSWNLSILFWDSPWSRWGMWQRYPVYTHRLTISHFLSQKLLFQWGLKQSPVTKQCAECKRLQERA